MQKWGDKIFSKQKIGNESLHQDSNDNGVSKLRHIKKLVVKSKMFTH